MVNFRRLLGILLVLANSLRVGAHEILTHQRIGDAALVYLSTQFPTRPILGQSASASSDPYQLLQYGAAHEDDFFPLFPLGRFYFHFDPPLSFASLSGPLIGSASGSCSSSQWGLGADSCVANCALTSPVVLLVIPVCFGSWQTTDAYGWSLDLGADATGSPSISSITGFGYVVHLLEDLGSPPHTRNDFHPCPLGTLGGLGPYCDLFEEDNDGADPQGTPGWQAFLNSPPVISTAGFTTPNQFFDALRQYVVTNYYSENTVGASGGPAKIFSDGTYIWGSCIPGVSENAGTCSPQTFAGQHYTSVRKIARGGPLYEASCGQPTGCDNTLASIDTTIAHEQFNELGPVIAQHVAAFIQFYAPALNVQVQGTGTGSVTSTNLLFPDGSSSSGNVNCGSGTCSSLFVQGTQVTLMANPDMVSGAVFSGWGQDCSGTATTVTITLTADMTCIANFSPPNTLTVQKSGNGTGTVTSSPTGIHCGTSCPIQSAPFSGSVQLTAVADSGSSFTGWSADCSGTALTTTISLATSDQSCIATFSLGGTLTVTEPGTGMGIVTSVPAGINCGTTCMAPLTGSVQLTATPLGGSTFAGWGGGCSGTASTTTINVSGNATCTATFSSPISVLLNPFGSQTISSAPGPYYVEVVNGLLTSIAAPADITVTIQRVVTSVCHTNPPLFSSSSTVTIPQGQTSTTYGVVAGRDPACNTTQTTSTFTVTNATMAPNVALNLTVVPAAQLSLAVAR